MDRIRAARTTGLLNLPLHDTVQNQIWLEMALDLPTRMPMLAPTQHSSALGAPTQPSLSPPASAASSISQSTRPWKDAITDAPDQLRALLAPD